MIKGALIGGKELVARVGRLDSVVKGALRQSITKLSIKLQRLVKQKLSDNVLRVRTGRLRRSITCKVDEQTWQIIGTVGTNVEYAARHEFGFHGTENVRAHLRMMKQAFGRPVKNPRKIMVQQHSRTVNTPARSFLRSSLADMQDEIVADMQSAITAAVKEAL